MAGFGTDQHQCVALIAQADLRDARNIGDQAQPANRRGGGNGRPVGLVVKRHIARDDGKIQRLAGLAHALDGSNKLAHDFRALRVAEIKAVGDCQRRCPGGDQVAPAFGNRLGGADLGVGGAIARGHVGGKGKALLAGPHPHHTGVATRPHQGVAQDGVVILLPNPAP